MNDFDRRMTDAYDRQMADVTAHVVRLRRDVLAKDRTGWTRQEWIDDAREIMDDLYGSAACLLNGHMMALLSRASNVEDQIAAGYAEGFEDGRRDYEAKVRAVFDELLAPR